MNGMSAMSVFNANVPEQSNTILNLDWSGFARSSDVEKASAKVAGAVEKASQKITADESKSSQKIIESVKAGSEKIVDAVAKIKSTTNAEQTATPPASGTTVFQESLQCIAAATARVAEHARVHPEETSAALQSAKSIAKQFNDLTDRATQCSEENKRLREAAAEVKRASGWIGGNLCGAGGGNNQCIPVGNAAFNALWERYGG